MEAAAMGRPVVAYDIRGMREVIEPQTGLLVPRGDRSALRERLESLLKEPEQCTELGTRCQKWVVAQFSEDAVIDRLRSVYRELLPRSSGREELAA
jgi:glycosyltransferase involved in cell wall biosynthesis